MSLRSYRLRLALALALALTASACGGGSDKQTGSNEPQTAKEKQLREAKAAGELDEGNSKWGKWRYTGDRKDCFFVVGQKCFKTENAACQAAKCKAPTKCKSVGGGPTTVSCEK